MSEPLMYSEIADWWPLLSSPEEYEEEAGFFTRTLIEVSDEPPRTILELGSGGGNNASHMKADLEMTLVDLSPNMLEVSKTLIRIASTSWATCGPSDSTACLTRSSSTTRSIT
jgi:ubiquinone/menaquinone biosynthesis C-methylase UbiE